MEILYKPADLTDIEQIFQFNKSLIDTYETIENIDYEKVLGWVRRKIEKCIKDYTAVFVNDEKVGYYHFYKNQDGEYELDDLYIFSEFRNKGIGSAIIEKCCLSVNGAVMLYVFVKNERAVALYKRLGFTVVEELNGSRYIMKRENKTITEREEK